MGGKEKLLRAADALFESRSFAEVGVATLLESARVQAPTLYHHFGDKEGLFLEWAEVAFAQIGDRLKSASQPPTPEPDAVRVGGLPTHAVVGDLGGRTDRTRPAFPHEGGESLTHPGAQSADTEEALTRYAQTVLDYLRFDLRQVLRDSRHLARDASRERIQAAYLEAFVEPLFTILFRAVPRSEAADAPFGKMSDLFLSGVLALKEMDGAAGSDAAAWFAKGFVAGFVPKRSGPWRPMPTSAEFK